ncbi:MAG: hypothetical protein KatS3mg131_1196 [Candidatus Tectimicrobiota bacterium]|nr:MAG: hypothetical protein KatS3mg131_1196 [Candidatus Tectomicrobia bacterium]
MSLWGLGLLPIRTLSLGLLVLANVLAGLSWSVLAVVGPVLVGRLALQGQNGEAMGIYNAVQGVSRIAGALIGGYMAQGVGYRSAFLMAGLLVLLAAGLVGRLRLPPVPSAGARNPKAPGETAP